MERESAYEFCIAVTDLCLYGSYWDTTPTGQQWAAMQLTSYIHGATGTYPM